MKKIKFLAAALLGTALLFVGCSSGLNENENNETGENTETDSNSETDENNTETGGTKTTPQLLTFNVGGSKALALVDDDDSSDRSAVAARAARNATTDSMIMKILEDGSMESFISIPEEYSGSLSTINYIAQSPADDADEIYIVFNNQSYFSYSEEVEHTDEWGNTWTGTEWKETRIGQLICVSSDGTYDDILMEDDENWRWLYGSSEDSVAFDKQGYMYYLVQESSGNSYTNMIYKYDPKTKESVQLTAPVPNTYYDKFQVSDDGKWIFVKANSWSSSSSSSYLRAIPTADPDHPVEIFHNSGSSGWINAWIYDNRNNCIYYNLSGTLYSIPEVDGTFSKDNRKTLFSGDSNSWFNYSDIFGWTSSGSSSYDYRAYNDTYVSSYVYRNDVSQGGYWYSSYKYFYFRNPKTEEQEIDLSQVLAYLFARAGDSFITTHEYNAYSKYYYPDNDEEKGKVYVPYNVEELEGIKYYKDTKYYYVEEGDEEYETTDERYDYDGDGQDESRIYVDYDAEEKEGVEYFKDNSRGAYYDFSELYDIKFDTFANVEGFEMLASAAEGKKNLEALQAISDAGLNSLFASLFDDSYYSKWGAGFYDLYEHNFFADVLYDKTTGEKVDSALIWHSDVNELYFNSVGLYQWNLFGWVNSSSSSYTWKSDYTKTVTDTTSGSSVTKTVVDAEKVLAKLATYCTTKKIDFKLTAFKDDKTYKGLYTELTNEDAIEFLDTPARISLLVNYMDNNWDSNNGHGKFLSITCFKEDTDEPAYELKKDTSSSIYWGSVSNLTTSYGSSLFGTYGNNLVKIMDEEGKAAGSYVTAMQNYSVVSTLAYGDGFYFQNALLDSDDEETGFHQIQYYDVKENEITNMFTNVTKNTGLEIVTFCAAGDYIYYSAVDGTSVVNGKINVNTLAATALTSTQKLSQIISVK